MYILNNVENPKAEVARVAAERAKLSGEYYHVVGVKAFLDGVTEAHTAWQNQDYADQPSYHGVERFTCLNRFNHANAGFVHGCFWACSDGAAYLSPSFLQIPKIFLKMLHLYLAICSAFAYNRGDQRICWSLTKDPKVGTETLNPFPLVGAETLNPLPLVGTETLNPFPLQRATA